MIKFGKVTALVLIGLLFSATSQAELVYLAKVNFEGKIFNDLIVLDKEIGAKRTINGSLTLPGVFTTAFKGYSETYRFNPNISFETTAIENGNKIIIKGYLESKYESNESLIGFLDVKLGHRTVRADLAATLIYKDDK